MNSLGEARKKLYEAYGEAQPTKAKPAKQKPRAKKPASAPAPAGRNQGDMTRRLAARIAAEMPEGTVASYVPVARAVLKELREPTTAMLEHAFEGHLDYSDSVEDWQRMVDAALNEPGFDS